MIIRTEEPGFIKITEREYTPSSEEMKFYYSGTHAGLNPDNPYNIKKSGMTRIQYKLIEPKKPRVIKTKVLPSKDKGSII